MALAVTRCLKAHALAESAPASAAVMMLAPRAKRVIASTAYDRLALSSRSRWTGRGDSATFSLVKTALGAIALLFLVALGPAPVSGQSGGNLIVFGDVVYFYPPGHATNCLLNNQFKRGEPVGFRMNASIRPRASAIARLSSSFT